MDKKSTDKKVDFIPLEPRRKAWLKKRTNKCIKLSEDKLLKLRQLYILDKEDCLATPSEWSEDTLSLINDLLENLFDQTKLTSLKTKVKTCAEWSQGSDNRCESEDPVEALYKCNRGCKASFCTFCEGTHTCSDHTTKDS